MSAKSSKADRVIGLVADSGASLWHDPDSEPYIDVRGEHGERRTLPVRSRECRTWLSGLMYVSEGSALGGQAATDAVNVLAAIAVHDGDERTVHVRLAERDGAIYLDLGDKSWRAVRITPSGWNLMTEPPVRFRRPRGVRSLPEPVSGKDGWAALRGLLHGPVESDWVLIVAWLVGTLHPSGPYPILGLAGEHGTGKTTVGRILRSIVDPSQAALRSPPRDDREMVLAARNSHILGLDNLSYLPMWMSDALCRIATGGGYSARELYTNGDEVIYSDRRPIIMTSIEDVATRADLADRTVMVHLPRIPDRSRRPERYIQAELDRIQPQVLGSLLDAVSNGLSLLPSVQLDHLPRMADYAEWIVACEPALPWSPGAFLAAYGEAREEMVQTGIDANPVAVAVVELLGDVGSWSGTASDLLVALGHRGDGTRPPKGWPETPQQMGGRMTRIAPLLRSSGWDVEKGEGRNRYTYYLTSNEPGNSRDAHAAHVRAHPRGDADLRLDRTGKHVSDGLGTTHVAAHTESPTATVGVSTREQSERSPCTSPIAESDPMEEAVTDV